MARATLGDETHAWTAAPARHDEGLARAFEALVAVNVAAQHGARLVRANEWLDERTANDGAASGDGAVRERRVVHENEGGAAARVGVGAFESTREPMELLSPIGPGVRSDVAIEKEELERLEPATVPTVPLELGK